MTRDEAGKCLGTTDGQHHWVEVTTLEDAGKIERYVCGRCSDRAAEVTPNGRKHMKAYYGIRGFG